MKYLKTCIFSIFFAFHSCTAPTAAITASESQLMTRQAQTREFTLVSKKQVIRASIATLQDLNFILDRIDADLGTLSASKYSGGLIVKATVTIREKQEAVTVRINLTCGVQVVENPLIYQDFFSSLDKSLFLVKNNVD